MDKLLTVIVPSYNMEKFLPRCLGSLIVEDASLLQLLDVIVVNDGSKDRTSEIAHDFMSHYPGVFRVIDKTNGHYGSCVNAALPVAKGKYIRILDADDYVVTEHLCEFIKYLAIVDCDVIISSFRMVDERGNVIRCEDCDCAAPSQTMSIDLVDGIRPLYVHSVSYHRRIFDGAWYHQLEGICYTDCQWCAVPMLHVSTVSFFPREITCYLCGREGQSVDPMVRIASMGQQFKVDFELARVHSLGKPKDCCVGAWSCFEKMYFNEISVVFSAALVGVGGKRMSLKALGEFAEKLERVDPNAVKRAHVPVEYAGGRIRCDLAQSWICDGRIVFFVKYWAYHSYRILRGLFPKRHLSFS